MLPERLRTHHLTGPGLPGPVEVVGWFGAMQAQDFAGVLWAIGQRVEATRLTTEADVLAAFDEGRFIRTHVLRPTWHVVPADDLRWMLTLSRPRVQGACASGYSRLGITPADRTKSERVLQRALEGGRTCTRHEAATALTRAGIDTEGQRLVYLLIHAELEGLICSGSRRGAHHTYALVDERVPPAPAVTRDEALATLVGRYFVSHGPATVRDCAWWSGLTMRDVREGLALAGDRVEERAPGLWSGSEAARQHESVRSFSKVRDKARSRDVHLLSNFDEYTVAYRDRAALLHASHTASSASQAALLSQPVTVGGRHAGAWRRTLKTLRGVPRVEVALSLVSPPRRATRQALAREMQRYAAFLGRELVADTC